MSDKPTPRRDDTNVPWCRTGACPLFHREKQKHVGYDGYCEVNELLVNVLAYFGDCYSTKAAAEAAKR